MNSENGMSIPFDFLYRHFIPDELTNSLNKFEDFENFKRGHRQNRREYVAGFDLKFTYRKLEKINAMLRPMSISCLTRVCR